MDRTIEHYKRLIAWTYSDGDRSDIEMEDAIIAETALTALDAVRWRDVSEHPKDGEDVLAMMKGDWICVVTFRASDSAYLGFGDCNETDDIKGWIPYPAWG